MNILFVTYDLPYPTNSGGKTRAYNLLKFARKDAAITLFSFVRSVPTKADLDALHELGITDVHFFHRRKVFDPRNLSSLLSGSSIFSSLYFNKNIFSEIIRIVKAKNIDLVHFESFYTGYYMHHELQSLGIKQVFGTENIEYKIYNDIAKRQQVYLLQMFLMSQVARIKKEEEKFYELSDCVLTVTREEKEYVRDVSAKRVEVIENGVDLASFKQKKGSGDQEKTLLFIGNFSYFPNIDAMRWFMESVFPKLPQNMKLLVVGKNASKQSFLRDSRVEIVEYVERITEAYSRSMIMIAPIRIGGGTNFKILEAMASKVPVVALSDRVGSFGFRDGKELMIADSALEFTDKIIRLFEDKKLRESLAANAYMAVEKKYSWTVIGTKLYNTWKSLL